MERVLRDRSSVDGRREAAAEALRIELRYGREVGAHEAVDGHGLQIRDRGLREPELGDEAPRSRARQHRAPTVAGQRRS